MDFTELNLLRNYDSDEVDLIKEFYRPVVLSAVSYDRAVGFFSSSTFASCASELSEFIGNSGQIRLIVGCLVSDDDIQSLKESFVTPSEAEQEILRVRLRKAMEEFLTEDKTSAALFAEMICAGVIELKFAVRSSGIYHEKFGIFTDKFGKKIAFNGSINETNSAWVYGKNHESFSVYQSIEPEIYQAYGLELEKKFDRIWVGDTKATRIYSLSNESLEMMREIASKRPEDEMDGCTAVLPPICVGTNSLRPYQKEAIQLWAGNRYKGILAMATGTGKTLTAIDAVKKFKAKIPNGAVIVTVPYQNLALQWESELRDQGFDVLCVFNAYTDWYEQVKNYFLAAQLSSDVAMPCLVCVNDSFKDDKFQGLLRELEKAKPKKHLIVVDECHHFNSQEHIKKLPTFFHYRLGLSATPYDQYSEHILDQYFDKIVFEFSLGRAIRAGYLTPYNYHIFPVSLDSGETFDYEEITRKIVKVAGSEDGFTHDVLAKIQPMLLQRARIVGAATGKMSELKSHLEQEGVTPFNLFYCGDGSSEIDGSEERQVIQVTKILHELGWRTARITAEVSLRDRETLLESLRKKLIDAVVSIKVLDEGIDIPDCRNAYLLASQRSDRQGIQRRGRVLRKSPGKDLAEIYDFVVIGGVSSSKAMRKLGREELRRALRFAADASNIASIEPEIFKIAKIIGLSKEDLYVV